MFIVKFLAIIFGAFAVFIAIWHYIQPRRVSLNEEWKLRAVTGTKTLSLVYMLVGIIVICLGAYGVTGQVHLALFASPAGIYVGKVFENKKRVTRSELLQDQYTIVLNGLISSLQGGLSPYQALEDTVPSMPRPARDVFSEILRRSRTGTTVVQATEDVFEETGWEDLQSIAVALRIYSRTGCNLAEVFKHILETSYEKQNDRRYVASVTSESRLTATLLSFLPFFLMGITRIMAPDFVKPLFSTLAGNIVIGICVAMVLVGNIVIKKMIKGVAGDVLD